MNILIFGLIGAMSGLFSSCWGAYKDSLFEEFQLKRYFRSVLFGFVLGLALSALLEFKGITGVNLGVFFMMVVTLERLATESLKAFIRKEDQKKYKIPSRLHILGKTVKNNYTRILVGIIFVLAAALLFSLPSMISFGLPSGLPLPMSASPCGL